MVCDHRVILLYVRYTGVSHVSSTILQKTTINNETSEINEIKIGNTTA